MDERSPKVFFFGAAAKLLDCSGLVDLTWASKEDVLLQSFSEFSARTAAGGAKKLPFRVVKSDRPRG